MVDLTGISPETVRSYTALAVSFLAFVTSYVFGLKTFKFRQSQAQLAREKEIFDWSVATIGVLSDMRDPAAKERELSRARLAGQIDVGRLLFPNDHVDQVRLHKPPERRGLRSHVLDPLIALYDLDLEHPEY